MCGTRVIWDPAPACTFKLQARASNAPDADLFHVFATVSVNGAACPPLRHNDIVPGPALVLITAPGQRYVIKPTIILTHDTQDPIVLDGWLEDANGSDVQIQNADGSTTTARCRWEADDDATPLRIKISVTT